MGTIWSIITGTARKISVLIFIYSIVFFHDKRLEKNDRLYTLIAKIFSFGNGLIIGGVLFGMGSILTILVLYLLANVDNKAYIVHIPLTRLISLSIFMLLLGIQITFSALYLGVSNKKEIFN